MSNYIKENFSTCSEAGTSQKRFSGYTALDGSAKIHRKNITVQDVQSDF